MMNPQQIIDLLRSQPTCLNDLPSQIRSFMDATLSPDGIFTQAQRDLFKGWWLICDVEAIEQFNELSQGVKLAPVPLTTGEIVIPAEVAIDRANYPRNLLPLEDWVFVEGEAAVQVFNFPGWELQT